ncbi:McrC family protein [Aliarcobacter butzleri]|uniref:McrC family protein n=1 Tax=Aliarcobacter butzleri TaxID=28197 RepID=UPI00263F2B85|nr:McrC family protein [Aliarcobacter butzleri]MDN5053933.1 McrC family protein [Aliarcobacter butzleri]
MKQNSFSILEYKSIYYKTYDIYAEDFAGNLVVPKKVFDDLKQFVLKNNEQTLFLKTSYKNGLGETLQAQNYVGVIQTQDGTTIEILPKIKNLDTDNSKKILIKMLKTLKKSPFKNFNIAHLKSSKMPLLEIFITMFLEELSKLIQKGIKSDYITKEENLKFLKGKLQINQQIKMNYIHKERFYVEFQEFLSNRVENKLIKTTLEFLYKKSKSNKNQQRIREFLFVFDEIEISHNIKSDFSKVKSDRQMKDYEQIILWCRTFLLENSFTPYKGSDIAFALLFDMNLLFESYVGHYLKKKGLNVSLQDKGKYLVEEPNKFALRPDIVINKVNDEDEQLIADTKWKIIRDEKDISQQDMYQLYAYGTKYIDCKKLYLIYPYDNHELNLRYLYQKEESNRLVLNVLFFDLSQDEPMFYKENEIESKYKLFEKITKNI